MASFKTILTGVGNVFTTIVGVEHTLSPVFSLVPGISPLVPLLDNIFQRVQTTIQSVEKTSTATGTEKAAAVATDFAAGLELTQSILAATGKVLSYDKAALQAAIDAQVAAYNAFAKVKDSFKVTDLPKA